MLLLSLQGSVAHVDVFRWLAAAAGYFRVRFEVFGCGLRWLYPRPHIFDPKILNHVKDMWCLLQEMRIKQADLWREDVRDAIQQTAEFA